MYSVASDDDSDKGWSEKPRSDNDGTKTATLDITDHVKSDETIESVHVPYSSGINCDPDDGSCSASVSTQVDFLDGGDNVIKSESQDMSSPEDTSGFPAGYDGTATTTDSSVKRIEVTNNASADGSDVTKAVAEVMAPTTIKLECGPTAIDDGRKNAGICAEENTKQDNTAQKIDVLANDSDAGNGSLSIQSVEHPEGATTAITTDDGTDKILFSPEEGTTGEVTFAYTVSDGDGNTDTATVTVDVGSCGEIRVSFNATNDADDPGGTADPTYDHDSIDDLTPQTAASSGDELTWRVPLEVATNTAELKPKPDYIDPPEGYQLKTTFPGAISKKTETGEDFTGENTSAWLGEDYEADSSGGGGENACSDGDDNDGDDTTDSADCNCANGATDSESSGGNCQDPQADFTTQSAGPQNQCLRLDGSGSTDEGEIVDYSWKLESSGSQPDKYGSGEVSDHSFSEQSSWSLTLTVTDNDGGTTSTTTINAHQVEANPDNTDCSSYFDNWGGDDGGNNDDGGGGDGGGKDDPDDGEDNPPETR